MNDTRERLEIEVTIEWLKYGLWVHRGGNGHWGNQILLNRQVGHLKIDSSEEARSSKVHTNRSSHLERERPPRCPDSATVLDSLKTRSPTEPM